MVQAFQTIQAQQAVPPTAATLLASSIPAPMPAHWAGGVSWRSELCPAYQVFDQCGAPGDVPADTDTIGYYLPPAYRVVDTCSTLGGRFDTGRVERMAQAVASYAVAHELWTGEATQADPYRALGDTADRTNAYLASADAEVITDAIVNPMEGLGLLEERARQITKGQQVFLHVPLRIITQLGAQLIRVGNEVRTPSGAIVVGDAGYPGTGPDGDAPDAPGTWAYATGPVVTMLGQLGAITDAQVTVDRSSNERRVFADRPFAALFDPCCHVAIALNVPPVTP